VRVVEDIRELGRERRPNSLVTGGLRKAQVVYIQTRTYEAVKACVPEAPRRPFVVFKHNGSVSGQPRHFESTNLVIKQTIRCSDPGDKSEY